MSSGLLSFKLRPARRLPMRLQAEASECGIACLSMIAAYHARDVPISSLRARAQSARGGVTLEHLLKIAAEVGFRTRAIRVELQQLGKVAMPCIVHWNSSHFVVLERAAGRHVTLHDPALGVRRLTWEQVSEHFTGIAVELAPSASFVPVPAGSKPTLESVVGPIVGLKRSLLNIFVFALALEGIGLVAPLSLQWIADAASVSSNAETITYLAIGLALLALLQQLINVVRSWAVTCLGVNLGFQWMSNVFGHLLTLPLNFFGRRHLADIVSRFGSIGSIQRTLTTNFIESVIDGLFSAVTFVAMTLYSPALAGVSAGAICVYALVRLALFRQSRLAAAEQLGNNALQQSHFLETIRGVRAIKLFNRQEERRATWMNLLADQMNAELSVERMALLQRTGNGLVFGLEKAVVIGLAGHRVVDGSLTIGMMFAFLAYEAQFATRVSTLVDRITDLAMQGLHVERLADITATAPEANLGIADQPAPSAPVTASVQFVDVWFAYGTDEADVLRGATMAVGEGEFIAITGASGSGKTTLMKAMLGILDGVRGDILIGGVSMRALPKPVLRDMIGTVMQDDQLFAGSIADNISFFAARPDPDWIVRCAQMASVHEDICGFPMRYNTQIGEMGSSLSGGQQQRIMLARALYKRPRILLLDEATSHLDSARERLVNTAVAELNMTRIVIAHRAETIAAAHRVLHFREGRLEAR